MPFGGDGVHLNCLTNVSSLLKERKGLTENTLCPKPDILEGLFHILRAFSPQTVTQMYFNYLYMENNGFQWITYNFYYSKIEESN